MSAGKNATRSAVHSLPIAGVGHSQSSLTRGRDIVEAAPEPI